MPTTIKYFLFLVNSGILRSSDIGELLSKESCAALAAASSISKFEIVLSRVLQFVGGNEFSVIYVIEDILKQKSYMTGRAYLIESCVLETSPSTSLVPYFKAWRT